MHADREGAVASRRLANIFGALTIAATDEILASALARLPNGGATAGALNLINHVPGLHIDALARALALSHPGTVRLVDRLMEDGLVERRAGVADRRQVTLHATPEGKRFRCTMMRDRGSALAQFLAPLTSEERAQLEAITTKLLKKHVAGEQQVLTTCRYCDEASCDPCPMAEKFA